MAQVSTIEEWVTATVNGALAPAARSRAAAEFARSEIAAANDTNRRVLGRVPPHVIAVDGRPGAPLESVNTNGGIIAVEWELIGDVLVAIGEMLERNSPRVSGRYIRGHTLFADGREVPINANVPLAAEYVFLNREPYSKKLEIGRTKSGRAFVIQTKPLIYQRTHTQAKARFGNIAKITYEFRAPVGGVLRTRRSGLSARADRDTRVPAIVVYTR